MISSAREVLEPLLTFSALVRLFSSMYSCVRDHLVFLSESPTTCRALIGPLSSVGPLMTSLLMTREETLSTETTSKPFVSAVSSLVKIPCVSSSKSLSTVGTHVRFAVGMHHLM